MRPHEVDVDAVHPALSGIEQRRHRRRQRHQLAACDPLSSGGSVVAQQGLAPVLVAEPGGVGQQVAQRDRGPGRAHHRLPVVVEPLEHARLGQVGQHARRGRVQMELAPLHELHGRSAGDGFGHGGNPANRVERHGARACRGVGRPLPRSRRGEEPVAGDDLSNRPHHVAGTHSPVEDRLHIPLHRHGRLPLHTDPASPPPGHGRQSLKRGATVSQWLATRTAFVRVRWDAAGRIAS